MVSSLWHVCGDFLLNVVIVTSALGWTTTNREPDLQDPFLLPTIVLSFGRWLITVFAVLHYHKAEGGYYHIYDGQYGYLESGYCLSMLVWFYFSIRKSGLRENEKYKGLARQLSAIAVVSFMIRPLGIITVQLWHPKYHYSYTYVVTVFGYLVQNILLSLTLVPEPGVYMEVTNKIELKQSGALKEI